ncbi:unnamed protein product, partial [Brassica napus]
VQWCAISWISGCPPQFEKHALKLEGVYNYMDMCVCVHVYIYINRGIHKYLF